MPTTLDGVSVLVNGTPAIVSYISPNQIDVLTPPCPGIWHNQRPADRHREFR